MRKFVKKIVAVLIVALMASQFSFVYALEKEWKAEDLSEDQQKAFITRTEFTDWVTAFTASLSEVDKNATQKIFDNMDFYDLQYEITILYSFDENKNSGAGGWASDIISRPEGWYRAKGDAKKSLQAFRDDAVMWEKHRRGLLTPDKPSHDGSDWTVFANWQKTNTSKQYEFSSDNGSSWN